jgi:hypothetical protein
MSEAPPDRRGRRRHFALALALAYLVPALLLLDDYGPTWDAVQGDYPYGERLLGYLETGDARFLDLKALEPAPELRAPHPDFDLARWPSYWVFPVGALLSAVSCRILWTELAWLPAMSAHHVPSVLLAAGLVYLIVAFAHARWGALAGAVAGGSLCLTPSFVSRGRISRSERPASTPNPREGPSSSVRPPRCSARGRRTGSTT